MIGSVCSACFDFSADQHSATICFQVAQELCKHLSSSLPASSDVIGIYPEVVLELAQRAVTFCQCDRIVERLQLSRCCELACVVTKHCEAGDYGANMQVCEKFLLRLDIARHCIVNTSLTVSMCFVHELAQCTCSTCLFPQRGTALKRDEFKNWTFDGLFEEDGYLLNADTVVPPLYSVALECTSPTASNAGLTNSCERLSAA